MGQAVSAERVVAAAILGGTTSVIAGGKFANGALTGAFGRAFNEESTIMRLNKEQNAALSRAAWGEKQYVDSLSPEQFGKAFPGTETFAPDLETSVTMVRYQFDQDLGAMMAFSYSRFVLQQVADSIGDVPRDMIVGVLTPEVGAAGQGIQQIYDLFSTAGTASSLVSGSATVYCSAQGNVGCIFSVKK